MREWDDVQGFRSVKGGKLVRKFEGIITGEGR